MFETPTRRNQVLNWTQAVFAALFLGYVLHLWLGMNWTPIPEGVGAVVSLAALIGLAFFRE